MANHRKTETKRVNPLLGGALLAGSMLIAAPAGMALGDTGYGGRPDPPLPSPGLTAIQTKGDAIFDSSSNSYLNGTGVGALYHGLYGYSTAGAKIAGNGQAAAQGLSVGAVNGLGTTYNVQCNFVVQTKCGGF